MPILISIFALLLIATLYTFKFAFVRTRPHGHTAGMWSEPPESLEEHTRRIEAALALRPLRMHLTIGSIKLTARYFRGNRRDTVVLIHGYRGESMHDHAHNVLYYHAQGYSVLAPDLRAHGESGGSFISFGDRESDDIAAWCRYLREEIGADRLILHGVSMGAATAIIAAARVPALAAVIADSAYSSGREILQSVLERILKIPRFPLYYTALFIAKLICCDIDRAAPIRFIAKLKVPILLIHGTADRFVPPEMSKALHAASNHTQLLLIEGARHAEASEAAPNAYYAAIERFLRKK